MMNLHPPRKLHPPGQRLYIIYAEAGRVQHGGPMVLTPEAFSAEEWAQYMADWRERGCTIVTVEVVESEND